MWDSPIAWEWAYERYWDFRETRKRGSDADVERSAAHLRDVLELEKRRLSA